MKRRLVALMVGNSAYPGVGALRNAANDARDIAARLTAYAFDVSTAIDATRVNFDKALREFGKRLDENDVGLFFFAGHGIQIEGSNYLLPIDADTAGEIDAKHSSMALDRVIDTMAKSSASTKIIILDACRNNPWERAWHRGIATRGLASVYAPKGTIIAFATSPGETADDGSGANGAYTAALLQHIDAPDCSIETMFKRVRNTLAADTKGKQTSWEHTSLSGEFYFNMGLGKLVPDYQETSLADSLLVIDENRLSHRIIKALKSHSWYTQNPAMEKLTADAVGRMTPDNLFVIGRNIYQAACGGANSASAFVKNFLWHTGGFSTEKRKAILDGMLFEVFFDSNAVLRPKIKSGYFEEVFDLQKHKELQDSFDFVAEALTSANGDYYSLPGKNHPLAVTVKTNMTGTECRVEGVYIDGANVLRESVEDDWDVNVYYAPMSPDQIETLLCEELIVPPRLMKLTFAPASSASIKEIGYPRTWTVKKK